MLTLQQLETRVPSIFTVDHAHSKTSDKYTQIPTIAIVEQLARQGYGVTQAMQSRTVNRDNRPFAKHMLRFRHKDVKPVLNCGLFPELVLINSHDGLSSYKLMAGLYRLVCSNGLVRGTTTDEIRIRHQGDILGNVIEGTYSVINTANAMLEQSAHMSNIMLSNDERLALANAACAIKFADSPNTEYMPDRFLRARNAYDANHNDLFTTFNVIQENMLKGGIRTYKLNDRGQRISLNRTREVKAIDANISLNKALWQLAERMAELKAA